MYFFVMTLQSQQQTGEILFATADGVILTENPEERYHKIRDLITSQNPEMAEANVIHYSCEKM